MTIGRVLVRVPATSANLGPGFDSLGLALGLYDEMDAERVDATEVDVVVEGVGAGTVATDETNLVVRAMHAAFDGLGEPRPGLRIHCRNGVPHGRGLGSSAAAIVAGVAAAWALAGRPEDRAAVLDLAAHVEGHPDNVAAAVLGGLTVAWTDEAGGSSAVRLDVDPAVRAVALVPPESLSTETARAMLPDVVPHRDAVRNAARAALLVVALTQRPDLLLTATEDRLHQSQRAPAMPPTADLLEALRSAGHAAVVSGAGPSVLVLGEAARLAELDDLVPFGWQRMDLPVDVEGMRVSTLVEP